MDTLPEWKLLEIEAKKKQKLKSDYPDIGKIVTYKGDYGVVVFKPDWKPEDEDPCYKPGMYTDAYAVRWDSKKEFDYEDYGFLDYTYLDEYEFKHINKDGTLKL